MMQMTQGRQLQRSETPEKQQLLHDKAATRKRRREAESPDQRERRLERQREYQRAYRRRRREAVAATEQTVGTSNELVCDSSRKGKSAKHVETTEILIEKRAIRLQKKRARAREVISVESEEHRESRLKRTRQHERDVRSVESDEHREGRLKSKRQQEQDARSVESDEHSTARKVEFPDSLVQEIFQETSHFWYRVV